MNTGTSIFLIIIIVIGSFVGLGYLYSQYSVLQSENQELRKQNSSLNSSLEEQRTANQVAQAQIAELSSHVSDLQGQLATAQASNANYADLQIACQLEEKLTSISGLPTTSIVIPPLIATSLLGIFGLLKKAKAIALKKQTLSRQKVSIQMTRDQLGEYIKYQRSKTAICNKTS